MSNLLGRRRLFGYDKSRHNKDWWGKGLNSLQEKIIMLSKQIYRDCFPAGIVRNEWKGDYLLPEEAGESIAVATTVRYGNSESDRIRSGLAYETFRKAREAGHEVVVVNGGCPRRFLEEIMELGVILEKEKAGSMGSGRRQAIRTAMETGRDVIAWTEPEKYPLVEDYHRMASPILAGEADSIVPFRTWEALKSYPQQQVHGELAGNLTVQNVIGYYLDLWFGPKFWKREATEFYLGEFEELKKRLDLPDLWDSTIIPSLLMHHGKARIGDVDSSYRHPEEQTEVEAGNIGFDIKRARQLDILTHSIAKVARWLGMERPRKGNPCF
jgi:hypothetical protein